MIRVQEVSKSFGRVRAVHGVSFEVSRGEVVGLLGSNGAGKSTTIRMIAGVIPPDRGRIWIDGLDTIDRSAEARRRIGYLPESAPAYGEMSVEELLRFRARLYGVGRRELGRAVGRVVELCELGEARGRRVGELSKGFRQRVGLAGALVHDPPVLILDEPTNALDPRQIRHTRSLVRELGREKAVLVSSHVLPEVERTCDRVVMMARGRVRADERPGALVERRAGLWPYVVEVPAGAEEAARRALSGVAGVSSVSGAGGLGEGSPTAGEGGWVRLVVSGAAGSGDLRAALASALRAAGVEVRELTRHVASLERVFMEVCEGAGAEDEVGGSGVGGGS